MCTIIGRAKIRFFSLIFIIEFGLVLFDSLIHSSAHKYFALLGYFHKRVNYYYPLDIYRHQNRLGIFIMMVLGEIVLELGVPPYDYKVMPQVTRVCGTCFRLLFVQLFCVSV